MWKDPIVEEVRNAGAKLAEKCNYDFHRFSIMIKKHQAKRGIKFISKNRLNNKILAIR